MVRPTVVLPQPDSPTRPSVSPGAIVNETSSTAFTVAVFDDRKPRRALTVKYLCRPSTDSSGSAAAFAASAAAAVCRALAGRRPACRPRSRRRASRPSGGRLPISRSAGSWSQTLDAIRAARRKAAAGGRRAQVGRQALDGVEPLPARQVEPRHRAHQADACRDGAGRRNTSSARALLDDARRVHHVDAVGVARDHAEIVRDDDQRDVEPARQILHQLEDLRLDGDVERGGRLVGDDQLRIAGKPDGDHHALAHAAGELMRILLEPALAVGDADQPQQLERARARLRLAHLEMDDQRLHDLQPDRQDRIERGHRLLEDHGDVAAAHLAHLARRRARAGCGPRTGCGRPGCAPCLGQQPHDGERRTPTCRSRIRRRWRRPRRG